MINNVLNKIDKISDKNTLEALKLELTSKNANTKEILKNFIDNYKENETKSFETKIYHINFGHSRTIKHFKKDIQKMSPYSPLENYRNTVIKAKGQWKDIYEISFGSNDHIITTKDEKEEKSKQMIIKEAA